MYISISRIIPEEEIMKKTVFIKFTSTDITVTCPECGGRGLIRENGEDIMCSCGGTGKVEY